MLTLLTVIQDTQAGSQATSAAVKPAAKASKKAGTKAVGQAATGTAAAKAAEKAAEQQRQAELELLLMDDSALQDVARIGMLVLYCLHQVETVNLLKGIPAY